MANINVDTVRLSSDGKRIIELSKQYSVLINDIFDRINNVAKNCWAGEASAQYRNNLVYEREFFQKLSTCINQYGNELILHSESIQNKIKKWESE